MSIQKTGWKIKQFLSLHRKTHTLDESGEGFDNISLAEPKQPLNAPRRLSWRLSQKSAEISLSPLRRTSSNTTTKNYQPPSTTESAYSSQISLCSCNCEANPESISYSLFRTAPLPNPLEILYGPSLSPSSIAGDAQTWRLIFSEPTSRSRSSSLSKCGDTSSSESTIRVSSFESATQEFEESEDKEKTPRQSVELVEDMEKDTLSDDVDQLIKETDEAFKAVGNALADAKAATRGKWYGDSDAAPRNDKRNNPITPPPKSSPSPRGISKKTSRNQLLSSSPRPAAVPSTPKRKSSVAVNKKKSKGVFSRALRGGRTPPQRSSTPPRWNLTDVTTNVVDVFSGKIFRTEVDEMLTPGRLQQIRKDMKLGTQRKNSADSGFSVETGESDTPTEPFHLESLSSRIDAANSFTRSRPAPFPPEPILPPPPPKEEKGVLEKKPRVRFSDPEITDERMLIADLQFPCPPSPLPASPRPSSKRPQPIKEVPMLPTIPEVSPITLSPLPVKPPLSSPLAAVHSNSSASDDDDDDGEEGDMISLPSTPFTITSPMFKHGPIRFSRSLLEEKRREAVLEAKCEGMEGVWGESEGLDWTAFQMAIQGTMDLPDELLYELLSISTGLGGYGSGDIKGKGVLRQGILDDGDDYFEWWTSFQLGPVGGIDTRASSPWDGSASSGILELEADLTCGEVEGDAKLLEVDDLNFPEVWASPIEMRRGEMKKEEARHKVRGKELEREEIPPPIPPRFRPRQRRPRPFNFQLSPARSREFSVVSKGSGDYSGHSGDCSVSSMDTFTPSTLHHTPHHSTYSTHSHTPSHLNLTAHTPHNSTHSSHPTNLTTPTNTYAKPMQTPTFARPMGTPASTASFPMSPMPQLTGVGSEVVMGSNLHHDLGDFLSWESQFVPFGEDGGIEEEEEDLYGA